MTKLRIMSDLHLEFAPLTLEPAGEDVLVLAGDIALGTDGIDWADFQAKKLGVPVVIIAGNHEFYGHAMDELWSALRVSAKETHGRVTFLEMDKAVVAGVPFYGTALWTDYNLYGSQRAAMAVAGRALSDHRVIDFVRGERFTPEEALQLHESSRAYLEFEDTAGAVIVTHHSPSERSVPDRFKNDPVSPAFSSNLDRLVEESSASLWIHGHTHTCFDYTVGGTRVVCNPRGYVYRGQIENREFNPNLVIEI